MRPTHNQLLFIIQKLSLITAKPHDKNKKKRNSSTIAICPNRRISPLPQINKQKNALYSLRAWGKEKFPRIAGDYLQPATLPTKYVSRALWRWLTARDISRGRIRYVQPATRRGRAATKCVYFCANAIQAAQEKSYTGIRRCCCIYTSGKI